MRSASYNGITVGHCSFTCGNTAQVAFSKSNVICFTAGAEGGISRSCFSTSRLSAFFHLDISTKRSATCLAWSSFLMKALIVINCINGWRHSLNVALMYQDLRWQETLTVVWWRTSGASDSGLWHLLALTQAGWTVQQVWSPSPGDLLVEVSGSIYWLVGFCTPG